MKKTKVFGVVCLFFFGVTPSFGGGFGDILFLGGVDPDTALHQHAESLLASLNVNPEQIELEETQVNDSPIIIVEDTESLEDALFALHRYLGWQALYRELRAVLEMESAFSPQVARMLIASFCSELQCNQQVVERLLRLSGQLAQDEQDLAALLNAESEELSLEAFQELIERVIAYHQGIFEHYLANHAGTGGVGHLVRFLFGTVIPNVQGEGHAGEASQLIALNFNTQVLLEIQALMDRYDPHYHTWQHTNSNMQRSLFGSNRRNKPILLTRRDRAIALLLEQAEHHAKKQELGDKEAKGRQSANKKEDQVEDDEHVDDEEESDEADGLRILDEEGNELQVIPANTVPERLPLGAFVSWVLEQIKDHHRLTLRLGEAGARIPLQGFWAQLPPELWLMILSHLDTPRDLLNVAQSCMLLHGIVICPNWQRHLRSMDDGSTTYVYTSNTQQNLFTLLGQRLLERGQMEAAARCFAIQGCFEGLILPQNYAGLCAVGQHLRANGHLQSVLVRPCQQDNAENGDLLALPSLLEQQALRNAIIHHYFNAEVVMPRVQQIALDSTASLARRINALVRWQTLLHQRDSNIPPIDEVWDLHSMALVMGVPFEHAEALINTLKQLCLRYHKSKNMRAKNFVASVLWDLLLIAQSSRALPELRVLALGAFRELVISLPRARSTPFIDMVVAISIHQDFPQPVREAALQVLKKMVPWPQ